MRSLYRRFEHLFHELSKFGTVGAIALVVNMVFFNAFLVVLPGKQIYARVFATFVATCFNYVGNRYWTYKDRDKIGRRREMLFFFVVNGVGSVIEVMFVFISKYGLNQDGILAVNIASYVFGLPLGTLFRLYCYRTFVFPECAVEDPEAAALPQLNGTAGYPAHPYQQPAPEAGSH